MDPLVIQHDGDKGKEGHEASTRGLTFSEVLHLLTRKTVLGVGIPDQYTNPPWRLPDHLPRYQEINSLLQQSMRTQAATVPGSDDFQDFILSNSSLAVSSLLRYYLGALGVSSNIVFGVLLWDGAAREGPQDYEGTPHVWLDVGGLPVDNIHVSFPASAGNRDYYWQCKQVQSYVTEDPLHTDRKLFLGLEDQEDARQIVTHNLKMLHTFSQPQHNHKYLAVSLQHAELNPGVKLYHLLMCQWMRATWGVVVPDIEEGVTRLCWTCGKEGGEGEQLKTCTECRVARYCHRQCQRKEWPLHKLLHKELETTREILDRNAREEEEEEEGEEESRVSE